MFAPTTGLEAARRTLSEALRQGGIARADLDARILVCAACSIDHAALIRAPDALLGSSAAALAAYARRRLAHEPVARILGRREFWGLPFELDGAVLDPRADTEKLVSAVLDAVGARRDLPLTILDLGTGSGAILCALLSEMPRARGVGVDRSVDACRVARRNVVALGVADRAGIVCGTWGEGICHRFDVVVSNPPYIARGEIAGLAPDVRDYDPLLALDGGIDGLDAYRAITGQIGSLLLPGGIVALECAWHQGEPVAALLRDASVHSVMTYKDLAGHDRVVLGSGPVSEDARDVALRL